MRHLTIWTTNFWPLKDFYSSSGDWERRKMIRNTPATRHFHAHGCASTVPQAPSKYTVTCTKLGRENHIPLPPAKNRVIPAAKWGVKLHCCCCKHPPHFHPTMPCTRTKETCTTHTLDSAEQEETAVAVSFASS